MKTEIFIFQKTKQGGVYDLIPYITPINKYIALHKSGDQENNMIVLETMLLPYLTE